MQALSVLTGRRGVADGAFNLGDGGAAVGIGGAPGETGAARVAEDDARRSRGDVGNSSDWRARDCRAADNLCRHVTDRGLEETTPGTTVVGTQHAVVVAVIIACECNPSKEPPTEAGPRLGRGARIGRVACRLKLLCQGRCTARPSFRGHGYGYAGKETPVSRPGRTPGVGKSRIAVRSVHVPRGACEEGPSVDGRGSSDSSRAKTLIETRPSAKRTFRGQLVQLGLDEIGGSSCSRPMSRLNPRSASRWQAAIRSAISTVTSSADMAEISSGRIGGPNSMRIG